MSHVGPENDQLCASVITKLLKEREGGQRCAASSGRVTRNEVYALRQYMLGRRNLSVSKYADRNASSSSASGRIGPNKIYELRKLMFGRYLQSVK